MIVSFTGHRPDKLGGYGPSKIQENCRDLLYRTLDRLQPTKAICGMALGWDQWAAEACVELCIPFTAAIPFRGQASVWSKEQQLHYHELLKRADDQIICSPGGYAPYKMQIRNVWMVNWSDLLIAGWNGTDGGTANTVHYAQQAKRDILILNPQVTYEQQKLSTL